MNMLINDNNAEQIFSTYKTFNRMSINHDLLLINLSNCFTEYVLAGGYLNQDLDYNRIKSII